MSQGQGSISRTNPAGAVPPFVNIAGARNGTSLDSSNFVVLGDDVGTPTFPGQLTSERWLSMDGHNIAFFGATTCFSNFQLDPTGQTGTLDIIDILADGQDYTHFLVESLGSPGIFPNDIFISLVNGVTPEGIATPGTWIQCELNGVQNFLMAVNGQTFWKNQTTGIPYFTISDAGELFGPLIGGAILQIEPTYTGSTPGTFSDIFISPTFDSTAANVGYTSMLIQPQINQTGSTNPVIGIDFSPGITAVSGELIAFRNTVGDVRLQSNAATGKTGVHNSGTLSAYLHIGPGAVAAGSGPFKLTAGPLLTVPEDGCIEYDGTNYYKTIGTTRSIIL